MFASTDTLVVFDLDKCRDPDTHIIDPEARAIIRRLNSYTEVSPTGTGVHIFAYGSIPEGRNFQAHHVEMYDRHSNRYMTLTGLHLDGTPATVNDRAAEITALYTKWDAESVRRKGRTSHSGGGAAASEEGTRNHNGESSNGRVYPHIEPAELPADFLRTIRKQNPQLALRIETHDGAFDAGAATTAHDSTKVDRSTNDFYIACELLRLGYSPEIVAAVLSHPTWFSGSRYRQYRGDYVDRTIANVQERLDADSVAHEQSGKVNVVKVAELIVTRSPYLNIGGVLLRYADGVFGPDGEARIVAELQQILGYKWSKTIRESVLQHIKDNPAVNVGTELIDDERVNRHRGLICTQNVMLNGLTLEELPHDPKYRALAQVGCVWDAHADTQFVEDFIAGVLPDDAIDTFWEYVAGTFIRHAYLPKKFAILVGPHDSGKSQVLGLIGKMLGERNISATPLQTLANEPFSRSRLIGKLANICAELPYTPARDAGFLKSITGGDIIRADRKHREAIEFRNFARLFFSTNELPAVGGADAAYYSRLLIFPCEKNVFDLSNPKTDPGIGAKLASPANLSAALALAVKGYQRLVKNGYQLTASESIDRAVSSYRGANDSVLAFFEEETEPAIGDCGLIPKQAAYASYAEWCRARGRQPVSDDKFFKRVHELMSQLGLTEEYKSGHIVGIAQRKQIRCYVGRRLLSPIIIG
jgi:putative DNA primase/helicase